MDIDEASDELYAVAPEEFTALRDGLVKQARAGGDRALATAVAALRKPTVSAYLANRLARENHTEVAALAELGVLLHRATSGLDGAALRELSRQQSQLIAALVGQVRGIAESEGRRFSDDTRRDLEDTVRAAIGDVGAAQALAAGRLAEPLRPGMSFPVTPVTAGQSAPTPRPSSRAAAGATDVSPARTHRAGEAPDDDPHDGSGQALVRAEERDRARSLEWARQRARVQAELDELEQQEDAARATSRSASEAAVRAAELATQAAAEVARLRDALEAAIAAATSAEVAQHDAVTAADVAEQAFTAAVTAADDARTRLAALPDAPIAPHP